MTDSPSINTANFTIAMTVLLQVVSSVWFASNLSSRVDQLEVNAAKRLDIASRVITLEGKIDPIYNAYSGDHDLIQRIDQRTQDVADAVLDIKNSLRKDKSR